MIFSAEIDIDGWRGKGERKEEEKLYKVYYIAVIEACKRPWLKNIFINIDKKAFISK